MIRVVHLSDPHHLDFSSATPWEFFGKRLAGGLNVAINRSRKHDPALYETLLGKLPAEHADEVVITGDFTNLALTSEFALARRWADRVAAIVGPERLSVIPGNHDAYTEDAVRERRFERAFAPFLYGADTAGYPYVKLTPELAILGLSTAVPTPFPRASGRLGPDQLARLEEALSREDVRARFRVVLIHHPPVPVKGGEIRQLEDRAAFAAVIARTGAGLILHGHDHMEVREHLEGPGGARVPVCGVTSATYKSAHPDRRGRFNVYEIEGGQLSRIRSEMA
jgi:3',5'-cyclic AMP phosphodiesterase CpdA